MKKYILDTDICIYWLKGNKEIFEKVEQIDVDNLGITIITLAELKYGAYKSKYVKENLRNINNFLRKIMVLPLEEKAADKFGKIKTALSKAGQIVDDFDILIATITLSTNGILVTRNIAHFKRIAGLHYENWL